jgi:hypothetical protein
MKLSVINIEGNSLSLINSHIPAPGVQKEIKKKTPGVKSHDNIS